MDNREQGMAQWWEHSPATNVAQIQSRRRLHMWFEFVVGSLLWSESFPPGYSGFSSHHLGRADTLKTSSWCAAKRFSIEVSSSSSYSIKMVHVPFCLNSLISRYHPFTYIRKLCCFNFVYFPRQVSNLVSRLSRLFRLGVVRACVLVTSLLWWRWKWF